MRNVDKKSFIILAGIALFLIFSFLVMWLINSIEARSSISKQSTPTKMQLTDCNLASDEQIDQIMAFIDDPYYLKYGYRESFESNFKEEFGSGFYIAAHICKEKDSRPVGIGVWYVFGSISDPRMVVMVNDIADIASPDLTMARDTNMDFSMSDDEAIHVKACVSKD